ncbi:hypothetical protein BESB_073820 [Besnoitia besnoiti]|uniref:Uncharacterized protein n=1 Tax=Besnoitia besnoiti TaxID=94643 RepID=A0A2A9MFS5_BESBE|nr:uncharacterized protein BESB_073820 [Besnoitia besnoiti]PFH34230.1 hypothetical protein BESB_073820 [Besnoitia besnoiti]
MEETLQEVALSGLPRAEKIQALNLLIKIINNILFPPPTASPAEVERFRCINSSSTALQQRLLRHGPVYENLLLSLGFFRTSDPPVSCPLPQSHQEYFFLPTTVERAQLEAELELIRATVVSLEGAAAAGGEELVAERLLSGGAESSSPARRVATTSRAIRDSSASAHAKTQEDLRQLREQQRERFAQRAETDASRGLANWFSTSQEPAAPAAASVACERSATAPPPPQPPAASGGGSRGRDCRSNAATRFFKNLFGGRRRSQERGEDRDHAPRGGDARGPRMKTLKDLPPAPRRRG